MFSAAVFGKTAHQPALVIGVFEHSVKEHVIDHLPCPSRAPLGRILGQ